MPTESGSREGDDGGTDTDDRGTGSDPSGADGTAGDGGGESPTIAGRTPTPPTDRRRTALLWGVAGVLSFGVVHQAYLLLGGDFLGFAPVIAVALLVGGSVATSAYWLSRRLADRNEQG